MRKINKKLDTICVLGFGIQGKAQALNLRDSGNEVIIGNINDKYASDARKFGFKVFSIIDAILKSKIIFILIPESVQNKIIMKMIFPNCSPGTTIIFAHGFWLRFEAKKIPTYLNILMIAPRYPGRQIRDAYLNSSGVPAFIDVVQDYSGNSTKLCKKICKSLGFDKGGLFYIDYKQEAEIDLFIEQFMAPFFYASVEQSFNYLINKGYSKEAVCMELYFSGELGAVRTMMGKFGLYKSMQKNASPTCQYGIASSINKVWNSNLNKIIKNQHLRIKSGKFQKELSDTKLVHKTLKKFLNSKISNQIKDTEKNLKKKLKKPKIEN
jgi:ketol-acid reductoisomerase